MRQAPEVMDLSWDGQNGATPSPNLTRHSTYRNVLLPRQAAAPCISSLSWNLSRELLSTYKHDCNLAFDLISSLLSRLAGSIHPFVLRPIHRIVLPVQAAREKAQATFVPRASLCVLNLRHGNLPLSMVSSIFQRLSRHKHLCDQHILPPSPSLCIPVSLQHTDLYYRTQPASKVQVTGTFDNWRQSIELDKDSGIFQRQVDIPFTKSNIHYKFIVDGTWTTDSSAPTEKDESGNINNFLKPSDISPLPAGARSSHGQHPTPNPTAAVISGVGPGSTAQMAGQVPLESSKDGAHDSEMPGAFPAESPVKEKEPAEFSVKPIPASSGIHNPIQLAPGDIVPDYGNNSSMAAVKEDPGLKEGDKAVGISPLPATAGTGNPIQTKPGEKLPSSDTYTSNSVQSHVKTDKASYEKSDAYPASSSANDARQAFPSGAFGVPPVSHNLIPESSLPMNSNSKMDKDGGPTIQSAGADTSTAAMAGQVPLEPRGVPEVVRESQLEANQSPEASSSKAAVADKDAVEEELKKKVPEEPSTSENSTFKTGAAAAAAGPPALLAELQPWPPEFLNQLRARSLA